MVLGFLSGPDATKCGRWVTESRMFVQDTQPSRIPSGQIIVGPWVIDPTLRSVNLATKRDELDGSFSRDGNVYVIKDVQIIRIRPLPTTAENEGGWTTGRH